MIQPITKTKLNLRPIFVEMSHLYVYEGPCRFGQGDELTPEFDQSLNAEMYKGFLEDIRNNIPDWVNLLEPVYVVRHDDWLIPDEMIEAMAKGYEETDFYLFGDGGRCGSVISEFMQRYPKPCATMFDCRGNALINATLLSHGCEAYPARTWEELLPAMQAVRTRKALRELKVLLTYRFNANQSIESAPDSFNDLQYVTKKFGTRFRTVNMHELMDELRVGDNTKNPSTPGRAQLNLTEDDMREIEKMADDLMAGAATNNVDREYVIKTLKAYKVIRKNMEQQECNAFTAPCPDMCSTRRLNEEQCTFCLSHSLNNEQGIPSACEYDVTALICMAILAVVSGKAPYMSNTTEFNLDIPSTTRSFNFLTEEEIDSVRNVPELMLTYHSVPNRKLHGFDSENSEYGLESFAYSGWSATLRYDFTQDAGEPITQIRIDPNCRKMMIARGTVVRGFGFDKKNCSEGLFFSVTDREKFVHTQQQFGLHMPLVLGDYTRELTKIAEVLGLEPVVCL